MNGWNGRKGSRKEGEIVPLVEGEKEKDRERERKRETERKKEIDIHY
jgi:hypothetical protein